MMAEAYLEEKLDDHTEFETKYEVDVTVMCPFKQLMLELSETEEMNFIYAQGWDYYYTKPNTSRRSFGRYRKGEGDTKAWWTVKEAPEGAHTNINRKELNIRVDETPYKTIHENALHEGYSLNFKIYKLCHIYKLKEVTFVYYDVLTPSGKWDHFIEIELDEDTIGTLTEEQAKDRIREYEKVLAPIGITYRNRSPRSLSERYWDESVHVPQD